MTVIVAFVGANGAVMAADTQATEADQTRFDVEKIWASHGLLFGYSGYSSVKDELARAIATALDQVSWPIDRHEARRVLRTATQPVLQAEYSAFVPSYPGQTWAELAGAMLVIGCDEEGFWLLEIEGMNTATFYTERGFHTVGSGSPGAQVAYGLLEHHEPKALPLRHLRLLAYRSVAVCIKVMGPRHVGGYVSLWSSQEDGSFAHFDEAQGFAVGVRELEVAEREAWRKPPS